eukprot:PhM_4_TR16654/c0_g1_i1/m.70061
MSKKRPTLSIPENPTPITQLTPDSASLSSAMSPQQLQQQLQQTPAYITVGSTSSSISNVSAPSGSGHRKVEHWPLPSWPADDPNRLKLRDLDIVKSRALGAGDQGTVFYATHKVTGKPYAVKELVSKSEDSVDAVRETFRNELLTLYKQVDTSHVLRVYDVYVSGAKMKLLMELMDLGSLVDVLTNMREHKFRPACGQCRADPNGYCQCEYSCTVAEPYGRLCTHDLRHVAYSIVHAMDSIHSKKILHRDLKPSNVLVASSGVVKVCDFGVSRLLGDGGVAMTTTGSQLYFAPERVTNIKGYDFKADVWSIGVLLAYCAVGRHPIQGKLFDVLTQVTTADFTLPLPREELGLSETFCDFVSGCCRPNSADRPTAHELLEHAFLTQEGYDPMTATPTFIQVLHPKDLPGSLNSSAAMGAGN